LYPVSDIKGLQFVLVEIEVNQDLNTIFSMILQNRALRVEIIETDARARDVRHAYD